MITILFIFTVLPIFAILIFTLLCERERENKRELRARRIYFHYFEGEGHNYTAVALIITSVIVLLFLHQPFLFLKKGVEEEVIEVNNEKK